MVDEEEKEVTKVIDGKEVTEKKLWEYLELRDYKHLSFTELNEAISDVLELLLLFFWVSRITRCSTRTLRQVSHSCVVYGYLSPLLRREWSSSS